MQYMVNVIDREHLRNVIVRVCDITWTLNCYVEGKC